MTKSLQKSYIVLMKCAIVELVHLEQNNYALPCIRSDRTLPRSEDPYLLSLVDQAIVRCQKPYGY